MKEETGKPETGNGETAVDSGKPGGKGLVTASCLGILPGSGLGLLVGVVLTVAMWFLLLGMLVAAPPLEFLGNLDTAVTWMLALSVFFVLGLPLIGAVLGVLLNASLVTLWYKVRARPSARGYRA